ncbi:DUF5133 domain-containing protein [Streptomyces sp. NBC_00503]|uniref:DUF5133 domain-containing protein n=1 Tax=Streptomyces sp. NBC_00503 TaxID=2903659 RepID=UPI002E8062E3|nr:DUF5133 domain-containing protein [Streptomyces sp. NBC_00503]WUD79307.1 DUF5133 domain-containing protein [Streptomyces sp. NBC_00503]
MARTPCSERDAQRILATAAGHAAVSAEDLAAAMVSAARGTSLPARVERALHHAVEAARTPAPTHGPRRAGLTPSPSRTEDALTRLRGCQARLAAAPQDPAALQAMDDSVYTLSVLMGRTTAHEAVAAAEEHLAAAAGGAEVLPLPVRAFLRGITPPLLPTARDAAPTSGASAPASAPEAPRQVPERV